MGYASDVLLRLSEGKRAGLVQRRAQEIYAAVSADQRSLPPARHFRDLLMLPDAGSEDQYPCST
jgi:hypothetical protein